MSDPGPDRDPDLEQPRTELQHARETANSDIAEVLDSLTVALGTLDDAADGPGQDDLESVRAELARLEGDTTGETRRSIDRARERVRAIADARLADDQSVSDRLDDQ